MQGHLLASPLAYAAILLAVGLTAILLVRLVWGMRLKNPKALPRNPLEVIKRMSKVCDEPNMVRMLYTKVAAHAGKEFAPEGLVLMLTLAAHDFGRQYPPPAGGLVQGFIPPWIDALIDDKATAEAAKQWLKQVEDKVVAERKERTPPRVEPEGPVEDDSLYAAVRKVSGIFFEEVERARGEGADISVSFEEEGVNPYYNQTDTGLFLEYYYGQPSKVWTPWGYWQFVWHLCFAGDPWPSILARVIERLGATEFMPERNLSYGTVGPVYAIHRVDDVELPEPQMREPQNYLAYEVATEAWESMAQRYSAAIQPQ